MDRFESCRSVDDAKKLLKKFTFQYGYIKIAVIISIYVDIVNMILEKEIKKNV